MPSLRTISALFTCATFATSGCFDVPTEEIIVPPFEAKMGVTALRVLRDPNLKSASLRRIDGKDKFLKFELCSQPYRTAAGACALLKPEEVVTGFKVNLHPSTDLKHHWLIKEKPSGAAPDPKPLISIDTGYEKTRMQPKFNSPNYELTRIRPIGAEGYSTTDRQWPIVSCVVDENAKSYRCGGGMQIRDIFVEFHWDAGSVRPDQRYIWRMSTVVDDTVRHLISLAGQRKHRDKYQLE